MEFLYKFHNQWGWGVPDEIIEKKNEKNFFPLIMRSNFFFCFVQLSYKMITKQTNTF